VSHNGHVLNPRFADLDDKLRSSTALCCNRHKDLHCGTTTSSVDAAALQPGNFLATAGHHLAVAVCFLRTANLDLPRAAVGVVQNLSLLAD